MADKDRIATLEQQVQLLFARLIQLENAAVSTMYQATVKDMVKRHNPPLQPRKSPKPLTIEPRRRFGDPPRPLNNRPR